MGFWLVVGFAVVRSLGYFVFLSGGVIRIYVRINEKLSMERFNLYLATKPVLQEERRYDDHNTIVHYSWEEHSRANGEFDAVQPQERNENPSVTSRTLNPSLALYP